MRKQIRSYMFLVITVLSWGISLAVQKYCTAFISPFLFLTLKMLLAGITLLAIALVMKCIARDTDKKSTTDVRFLIKGGICCGIALFFACSTQQIAFMYTSAGKVGFITAMYVIFVPVLGAFAGKKISSAKWVAACVSAVGLYFLCMGQAGMTMDSMNIGDIFAFAGAFFYAVHILVVGKFAPRINGLELSCIQFIVGGLISLVVFCITDHFGNLYTSDVGTILDNWFFIAFSGIIACAGGYTFQIIGQKNTSPTTASLILSMEGVTGAMAGIIFLGEKMSIYEIIGAGIMLAAIILVQLVDYYKRQ